LRAAAVEMKRCFVGECLAHHCVVKIRTETVGVSKLSDSRSLARRQATCHDRRDAGLDARSPSGAFRRKRGAGGSCFCECAQLTGRPGNRATVARTSDCNASIPAA
jgi:hypothetical protein